MDKVVYMFGGKIHSGKNFAAGVLKSLFEKRGIKVENVMLAQGVKDGCYKSFKQLAEYLNTLSEHAKENGDDFLAKELHIEKDNWYEDKTTITRILLQTYGTEIFRDQVSRNYWTNKTLESILNSKADVIIITDFRFPDEYNTIYAAMEKYKNRAYSIIVERKNDTKKIEAEHSSENSLDNFDEDFHIDNNGTVEELEKKLNAIVDHYFNTKK